MFIKFIFSIILFMFLYNVLKALMLLLRGFSQHKKNIKNKAAEKKDKQNKGRTIELKKDQYHIE